MSDETAIVIAQHMARDEHARLVLSLLNKEGSWPAEIPDDGTELVGGRVYLLPAEQDGAVSDSDKAQLKLMPPAEDSYSSPSVNQLLRSLAEHYGSRVLALILSGAGSDGAQGCRVVKQNQGQVWIQSPEEAAYDSMPQTASEAVKADYIGTIADISLNLQQLLTTGNEPYADHPEIFSKPIRSTSKLTEADPKPIGATSERTPVVSGHAGARLEPQQDQASTGTEEEELQQITHLIEDHTGISFAGYKQETLLRRIDKRKSQIGTRYDSSYAEYLQRHPGELELLEQYLLVSVSSFFRDADVFRGLSLTLTPIIEQKRAQIAQNGIPNRLRFLVAGCATGEEAYSLAILCRQLELTIPVEILAVDLNRDAIRIAEKGEYSAKKLSEMPSELVERYFVSHGDCFVLDKSIREEVRFIQGDIFAQNFDEAFDFVSCRNLMIYLKREEQDRLINHLYQQMNAGAGFVIGMTESLSPDGLKLFSTQDYYHRIFKRR